MFLKCNSQKYATKKRKQKRSTRLQLQKNIYDLAGIISNKKKLEKGLRKMLIEKYPEAMEE